ncbi:NAD-glutamate dehydrogenase domain-containing protein [Fluviispira vulneris]|uniref:NAD-glutamate dehydrogenase domain-containing protein n=1 Tax=Fluviispira vulneris TaxID=2763012 RepID=UPI001648C44F|nr:NAD-glutamate dehydrogenase domain-containing protein [Fluviispira vulneris]
MTLPKIHSHKWLSEVELLDSDIEPSESLMPANIEKFFAGIADTKACANATNGILSDIAKELEHTVPWFLSQMPPLYLWSTSQKAVMDDILEIVSGKVLTERQVAERVCAASQTVTLIAAGEHSTASVRIAPELSRFKCKLARLFNSLDKKIGLCEIYHAPYNTETAWSSKANQAKQESLKKILSNKPKAKVDDFISSLDKDYVDVSTVKQMALAYDAIDYCMENENSFVNLTTIVDEMTKDARVRVDICLKHFPVNAAMENIIGIFNRYNFQVRRLLATEICAKDNQKFTVLHLISGTPTGEVITEDMKSWGKVLKSLKTLSYVDHGDEFTNLLQGENPFSLNETNLVRALANWVHIFLTKQNPYYYSIDRVSKVIVNNPHYMDLSIKYFRARFDPRFQGERKQSIIEYYNQLKATFVELNDVVEKNILKEGLNFLNHILKTNYFLISKGGLTFRMDPSALDKHYYPEMPFGIFYMIGRNFRAFQVRYRDISRGGMRVVMPRSSGDYENALAGIFDEVNGLASAQQLKNKDIPEGGSKCVMVVRQGGDKNEAVKAAISGLLDLIVTDPVTGNLKEGIIDYHGKEEIIYLGPDENLTDDLIVWIIKHALHRKYKYAYAFMSSKPDFGINHKVYGVTSEGVNVYVDNVLRYLGLQNSTFRVKMTGGPDGDVAGNELNILYREYGERCRVVSIGDGFGAAYDPKGLNWQELLRLYKESRSIVEFNPQKLSGDSKAFVISANTKENMKIRDTLYATVEAEIFIPAGGRPYTVKESNWDKYLLPNGKPSSLAIVEGANIFFTKEARQKIVDSGAVVIKDSSANKAGVSCSSYEIIACLTISPEEFSEIKDIYVKQVLTIIRFNADQEAKLLFREWQKNKAGTDLVKLSYEISTEINSAKDILLDKLNLLSDEELSGSKYNFILLKHCPGILVEKYRNRIIERLPRAHKIAILSAHMASHLVYREGLNWLESMHPDQIFKVALDYMDAERNIEKMVAELENSNISFKNEIAEVLKAAGAKHLASHRL